MEIEYHAIRQWMDEKWDEERNQKVSGNKWKLIHSNPKLLGHSKGNSEMEVHSNTGLPKKDRNISNKQPNLTSTRTGRPTNTAHNK